jgi:hypothetical protein
MSRSQFSKDIGAMITYPPKRRFRGSSLRCMIEGLSRNPVVWKVVDRVASITKCRPEVVLAGSHWNGERGNGGGGGGFGFGFART